MKSLTLHTQYVTSLGKFHSAENGDLMAEIQNFRLSPDESVLLIVDLQEKLMTAMPGAPRKRTLDSVHTLIEAASHLGFPIMATEQYPKGLGPTVASLAEAIPNFSPFEKMTFSCTGAGEFISDIKALGRSKIILTGCETHVCCYQTALDLMEIGFIVHAVGDALCSRQKLNWQTGLAALERAGAIPTTTEQVLFDLLKVAGTENFKALSRLIK